MKLRSMKSVLILITIINLISYSLIINIGSENTNSEINIEPIQSIPVEELPQMSSRSGSYVIDLNTETDEPHHNITIYGANKDDSTGNILASGDINGDNIEDLIIGTSSVSSTAGKVYVVYGRSTPSPVLDLSSSPDITITGIDVQDYMGRALATGDINGDNIDDIILSANYGDGVNNNKAGSGEVYIIYGNKSLPSTWSLATTPANVTIYGVDINDNLGFSIASGDINGDDFDDVIMGAWGGKGPGNSRSFGGLSCGEVYVLFGNGSLASSVQLSTSANMTIYGREAQDRAGWNVGSCNINNDSYDDIVISAINGDGEKNSISNCGDVYVIYGNKTELIPTTLDLLYTPANITINGTKFNEYLGAYTITSGDLNGDTIDDLILGSQFSRTYIFYGNDSYPTDLNASASNASVRIFSAGISDYFGYSISIGNINNDGYDDIIIGAYNADGPGDTRTNCGGAYVVNGSKSLPSIIDFKASAPNITIYGAKGWVGGIDGGDAAGTAVSMCDYNGDGLDDLILGAPGGNGRINNRVNSGEVCIILLDGETLPLPYTTSVSLKNGAGVDGKTCYAQYEPYQFEVKILTPNEPDELESVMLHLGYYTSVDKIKLEWFRSTGEFTELNDPNNYIEIDSFSNYSEYNKVWTINFYILFNWNYTTTNYQSVQVRTTGSTGLTDWANLSNRYIYIVENRLNFTGDLEVISESRGELSEGDWVLGGDLITWKGVKVVYFDTTDLYPPQDIDIAMAVTDPKGNTWTKMHIPGLFLSLKTLTLNETIKDESYTIKIIGIPPFCDVSDINFKLNIDHDNVSFSSVYPDNKSWQGALNPSCRIRIYDPSTNVENSSIEYRTSTDSGQNWGKWNNSNIVQIPYNKGINCTVKPALMDGANNLIQWRAKDIVGNNYTKSPEYKILVDVSNITFSNPFPDSNEIQSVLSMNSGITVSDVFSGVNASSIDFSTSTSGIWGYGAWQSARITTDDSSIQCSVNPVFKEGEENFIRWRAKDVVGNGYNISDNYQIKIEINYPPTTILKSPENGSIINTLTPELVWEGSDPNNDTIRFDIYLSPVKNHIITLDKSARIKENITNEIFKLETPFSNKLTYYWTIIPNDNITTGICTSGVWQFKVDTTAELPIVTLKEPINNSIITTTTPKLSWELNYSKPEIVTFKILLTISNDPEILINEDNAIQKDYKLTTFPVETPLTPGETYFWSVIPIANLADGIIEGSCISQVWNFKVDLPPEKIYKINMSLESTSLIVTQGNYTSTNVTITNLGNFMDMIEVSKNQGILDANIAIEHSDTLIRLNASEEITIKIGILVSEDAKQYNYTIYFTARSTRAINDGKEESITISLVLQILEKKIVEDNEKDDEKGERGDIGEVTVLLWVAMCIIIILIIVLFLYVYRVNKAKKIPYVKSEVLLKPPRHIGLMGAGKKPEGDLELPPSEEAIPTLDGKSVSSEYQLPKAVLTKAEKLELLEERFLLGEVTEETYKELKTKLEGSEDISELDSEEFKEDELIDEELLEEEPLPFEEPEMEPDDEDLEIDEAEEVEKIFKESTIAEEEDFRPLEVDIEDREDDDLIWRPDDAEQESHETAETVIEKKKPKKKIKKSKLKKNVTRKI